MALARYDAIADFYVQGFDSLDDPATAALLELLGPVTGLRVLDAACGHGRITREVARRGAHVTGLDLSAALIERAQAAEGEAPLGITYSRGDLTRPGALEPAAYDVVTCNFGLSDIDDLEGCLAGISAALRPGGRFVFSILHPCFPGGPGIAGSWPESGRYYDERRWTPASGTHSGLRRQVGASHRTLATYLNTLRRHDLHLDEVAEPLPAPGWDEHHQADRMPVYLAARTVRGPA
jgi:2-polyprenyl-3-methyl-5-hydroxy-6-metoxy-1,4-benzoquinol methylase